jgi:hypothetical protein
MISPVIENMISQLINSLIPEYEKKAGDPLTADTTNVSADQTNITADQTVWK